jgi:hypothetical protein
MAIVYILLPIGEFNAHLLHFVVIWYIFSRFGILYQEKSGNPGETRVGRHQTRNDSTEVRPGRNSPASSVRREGNRSRKWGQGWGGRGRQRTGGHGRGRRSGSQRSGRYGGVGEGGALVPDVGHEAGAVADAVRDDLGPIWWISFGWYLLIKLKKGCNC